MYNYFLIEELQDIVNKLVGRKYDMQINIVKSQVLGIYRSNASVKIRVGNRRLKKVDHFIKDLGNVLTRDGYCTREIKMRIAIATEALNRKISLLTSKLHNEVRKKLICVIFVAQLYMAQRLRSRSIWRASKCGDGGE